eukprot:CAMPEP_0171063322 /NCGR_PEP_ID=MMETSP0766_2-20121228/5582_1 /TAXON_ID=439317 /ORGANISM="Gambierdiscus australes, Strain CAWD 149" /LENGTH=533 /DNA_ID=CAMNT_0011519207 /DNA_START=69 /DNA_END=1670 /DNA_ORIENTATION=+
MNGNGITSLAECDRLIVTVLHIEGVKIMKPVINRAFHAARDIVPSVGSISPHYVDFHEFRYFLIYLQHYLELFLVFCACDSTKVRGRYSDRRMSYPEFERAIPRLVEWGLEEDVERVIMKHPQAVFRVIDDNGGGVVLFDEFAHWALWYHIFNLDGDDDADMAEALDVLRKQKPNLCGKDLSSIRASKAKYRADARISGQGCLGGDPSLAGGYDDIPDGGKELAEGRHYPGGLAAWNSSFHGKGQDGPGRYRCVATKMFVSDGPEQGRRRVGTLHNGTEFEVLEVEERHQDKRLRARIADPDGWVSLLNTRNGFRWATRLRKKGRPAAPDYAIKEIGTSCVKEIDDDHFSSRVSSEDKAAMREVEAVLGTAWRDSLDRVEEASEQYASHGAPLCVNGCGQPRFGRYPTCCTHCKGPDGPHARSCVKTGYDECVNRCGHPQFGKYETCCTHCVGPNGPHARGCVPMDRPHDGPGSGLPQGHSDRIPPAQPAPALCQPIIATDAVVVQQSQHNVFTLEGVIAQAQRAVSSVCTIA